MRRSRSTTRCSTSASGTCPTRCSSGCWAVRCPPSSIVVVASAYRPGSASLEVGGDWYDASRVENGAIALVVGDVVGHGLEAAVAMGQLRGAVSALAQWSSPAVLLERLDAFVETVPSAATATLAYVDLDPDDRRRPLRLRRPPAAARRLAGRPDAIPRGTAARRRSARFSDRIAPERRTASPRARPSCSTRTGSSSAAPPASTKDCSGWQRPRDAGRPEIRASRTRSATPSSEERPRKTTFAS